MQKRPPKRCKNKNKKQTYRDQKPNDASSLSNCLGTVFLKLNIYSIRQKLLLIAYFAVHLKSTKDKENNQNGKRFQNGKCLQEKKEVSVSHKDNCLN